MVMAYPRAGYRGTKAGTALENKRIYNLTFGDDVIGWPPFMGGPHTDSMGEFGSLDDAMDAAGPTAGEWTDVTHGGIEEWWARFGNGRTSVVTRVIRVGGIIAGVSALR